MQTILRKVPILWMGMVLLLGACAAPGEDNSNLSTAPAAQTETTAFTPGPVTTVIPDTGMMTGTPGDGMDMTPGAMMTGTPGGMMGSTPEAMMTGTPGDMMRTPSGTDMPAMGGEFDQMFIDMMVPHHQSAMEMARIAQERSQNPEVLQIAENILTSQQTEIDQMTGWREEWYGSSETPPMNQVPMMQSMEGMEGETQMMDMQAEVEALRQADEPFDVAFINAMIPHHQSAINAAQMALQQATHQEIKDLAEQIIADQQREIDEMQSLLAQLTVEPAVTATP